MKTPPYQARLPLSLNEIAVFCRRWRIEQFALFGSILRPDFRPDSDVDVLVTFAPEVRPALNDRLRMTAELSEIFHRRVDLVERRAIEEDPNYLRRRNILSSAEVIYGT